MNCGMQNGSQRLGFELPEVCLALPGEYLVDRQLRAALNFAIQIDAAPAQQTGKLATDRALAGGHKTGQRDDRYK